MNWTGKKVLVTGAGGFIGSHLTERLVELGADVSALVRYTSTGTWGWLDRSTLKDQMKRLMTALGYSQYHLAVAGGYAVGSSKMLRMHPPATARWY